MGRREEDKEVQHRVCGFVGIFWGFFKISLPIEYQSLKKNVNKQSKVLACASYRVHFGAVALVAVLYDRLHPRQGKVNPSNFI